MLHRMSLLQNTHLPLFISLSRISSFRNRPPISNSIETSTRCVKRRNSAHLFPPTSIVSPISRNFCLRELRATTNARCNSPFVERKKYQYCESLIRFFHCNKAQWKSADCTLLNNLLKNSFQLRIPEYLSY